MGYRSELERERERERERGTCTPQRKTNEFHFQLFDLVPNEIIIFHNMSIGSVHLQIDQNTPALPLTPSMILVKSYLREKNNHSYFPQNPTQREITFNRSAR